MGDSLILGKPHNTDRTVYNAYNDSSNNNKINYRVEEKKAPEISALKNNFAEANRLLNDVVLKKYLYHLDEMEIVPLDSSMKNINDIRLFKINEMVYQPNEYSTYKFSSVFSAVQHLNCGVFILMNSNGEKTDFYMGIRAFDNKRTSVSLKDTLCNALKGQFPGVKTMDLFDDDTEKLLRKIKSENIASVSCVAQNKDKDFKDNEKFIQGMEKLALAMQGKKYTAVILAKSVSANELEETRNAYETIYTQLSPFANMHMSYGTSMALNISDTFTHSSSVTESTSDSVSSSTSKSSSRNTSESYGTNYGISKQSKASSVAKGLGTAALSIASILTAPMTGGASIAVAGGLAALNLGLSSIPDKSENYGNSSSTGKSYSSSESSSESKTKSAGYSSGKSESNSRAEGTTDSSSENLQLNLHNKSLMNTLEKIDTQLKRFDECESIGMWECAAYFLSESQETAEMAAGTYKSIMKGEKSGIETSAINFWGRKKADSLPVLRDYITNFIHPVFNYKNTDINISAASLISSNELAIHMGLPRKSVCGFPVIKHADFGKEVVSFDNNGTRSSGSNMIMNNRRDNFEINGNENIKDTSEASKSFELGRIFSMGEVTDTKVRLDCNSLTMHTFVTGSTGSGKSNTVYEILNRLKGLKNLKKEHKVPFLVIEPAKGEYKNVFGKFNDVHVYGTNPKKSDLIKINPFSFNEDIHILEHLDRLVEIFNVCWSMYAAMPAILKDAMEKAYVSVGWDLGSSTNKNGRKFPNFVDLLEKIEEVVNDSAYSSDTRGDYSGALLTRVRSLTNGLNGQIFSRDEIPEADLFDKCVIVDLSRVGSAETKSLIMGLLIMKLNEYRMASGKINSELSHITVLEEAHNILKRTSAEQSSEGANLLGKSVEMLANSIAEMRTYGEGFIIADQSPGLLDMSVIRNTNTKIILRLPDKSDRELVGFAAGLNEEQINEISKLRRGVAAVYQNDWVEPVLVQVNKCGLNEEIYSYNAPASPDLTTIRTNVVNFLLSGYQTFAEQFDIELIRKYYFKLQISSADIYFIESQINEFDKTGNPEIWEADDEVKAKRIVNILGIRSALVSSAGKYGAANDLLYDFMNKADECLNCSKKQSEILVQLFVIDLISNPDISENDIGDYEELLFNN